MLGRAGTAAERRLRSLRASPRPRRRSRRRSGRRSRRRPGTDSGPTYDLVLAGATVIDPAAGRHEIADIGLRGGRIAAIARELPASAARERVDLRGHIVTPGLIDLHTHVAEAIMPIALPPDEAGVRSGVTTVCDAGSVGYATWGAFEKLIVPRAKTDVFCFLHLCPTGQAVSPEIAWESLDLGRVRDLVGRQRAIIKGLKLRANGPKVAEPKLALLRTATELGAELSLPLMVHVGLNSEESVEAAALAAFTRGMLDLLRPGDILTHAYTQRTGGLFDARNEPAPGLREAVERTSGISSTVKAH